MKASNLNEGYNPICSCNRMMEVFQLKTNSWLLSKQLFIEDPLLSTSEQPIYCHILTGTLAVCLSHKVSAQGYDKHLFQYLQRYKSKESIVHIYNITLISIVSKEAYIEVMCQKMCFEVDKIINQLSSQQQLYIIHQIIKTTRILNQVFGFFTIKQKMVGLNKKGEVRMWINSNHADNKREVQLGSEQEQFQSILEYLMELRIQNKLINAFINNIITMNLRFKEYEEHHGNFVRVHQLQAKSKVNLSNINKRKKPNISLERQLNSVTPSLKSSNVTTDMSSSLKANSLSSRFSQINVVNSYLPRHVYALSKKRQKGNQENQPMSIKHKQKIHYNDLSSKYNLANRAKLQESIFIQGEDVKKSSVANLIQLELLGKMGKVCQSTTAEELILQQFKSIYQ